MSKLKPAKLRLQLSVPAAILAALLLIGLPPAAALANCVAVGLTTTCDGSAPNPFTTTIGSAAATPAGTSVIVGPAAQISVINGNAISLGDSAKVTLQSGSAVTTTTNGGATGGGYGKGDNTIEFNNYANITIQKGASVIATGTQQTSEAINAMGGGNTVVNYGLVQGGPSSAIFFENLTSSAGRNSVDNYGTISALPGGSNPGLTGEAIGSFNNVGINFINETGGVVKGNLDFQGGNDNVTLFTGSKITGDFDGGGGTNTLTLDAVAGASDSLPGVVSNFQTLTKTGAGLWTLTGSIGQNSGAPLAVFIVGGTLELTGNNANFDGSIVVNPGNDPTATLEARAQSLPPTITDNGIVLINQVSPDGVQPADGTYAGVIQGTGVLVKQGAGTLTLTGVNTYSGGTFFNQGLISVAADSALGAPAGGLTFNGGGLQFASSFNLSAARAITLNGPNNGFAGGGTFDTRGYTTTIQQQITGSGSLTKLGTGSLILTGIDPFSGGTEVTQGTLIVGDATHQSASLSGAGAVTVASGATLGGYGSVAGSVTNYGTIAVANAVPAYADGPTGTFTVLGNLTNPGVVNLAGSSIGNVLSVHGNYDPQGGTVVLNALLNGGGALSKQSADRLLILGSASGSTVLDVHAIGSGAFTSLQIPSPTDGISLVQVAGASSATVFSLANGYLTGGTPYRYQLYAYGPGSPNGTAAASQNLVGNAGGNWDYRLQSVYLTPDPGPSPDPGEDPQPNPGPSPGPSPEPERPAVAPAVPAYITAPSALFNAGLQDLDSLHRRLGEIRDSQALGTDAGGEVFVRGLGGSYDAVSNRGFGGYGYNFSEDYGATQIGGNWIARNDQDGTLRAGFAGTFGRLWMQPSAVDGASKALFNTQTGAGVVTWQARSGWYIDGIVSAGAFDGSVTTEQAGAGTGLNGSSVAVSVEAGYPFPLPAGFSLEPQAQLVYQHLDFRNRVDGNGIDVNIGGLNQSIARAGVRLVHPFVGPEETRITPYAKLNVLQGFGSTGDATIGNVPFGVANYGTSVQIGGGVTGTLTRTISVYGDVAWQQNVVNDGGFRGWSFNAGLRWTFGTPPPAVGPGIPAPPPAAVRSYLVFFDWDRADLTDRAREVVAEAARSAQQTEVTRISVDGYTDTSGTQRYNMALSLRRAKAVAAELVRDGVKQPIIAVNGLGDTRLLVATGPGVREAQNRRVEIVFH
jgi:outer membrane autotransporter protein